ISRPALVGSATAGQVTESWSAEHTKTAVPAHAPLPIVQAWPTGKPLSATPSQSSSFPLHRSAGPLPAQSGSAQSMSPSQSSSRLSVQLVSLFAPPGQAQLPFGWHFTFAPQTLPAQSGSAQSMSPSQSSSLPSEQFTSLGLPPGQAQLPSRWH